MRTIFLTTLKTCLLAGTGRYDVVCVPSEHSDRCLNKHVYQVQPLPISTNNVTLVYFYTCSVVYFLLVFTSSSSSHNSWPVDFAIVMH